MFYLTTAIDYTNGAPHIGHAYEKILADVLCRYHRLRGDDVYFLTGVDQHGQKVQQSAAKAGVEPPEFVRTVTAQFQELWARLGLSNDGWATTTDPRHSRAVRAILQRLYDAGEIYRGSYQGAYSVRQEQFLTDKDRAPDGTFGPEWGEVMEIEETTYYFKVARHRDWLLAFLDAHPDCVRPAFRQAELRNAVERISGDLSISRPKARLSWGIELPFDSDYVTYVWFDALVNYITFAGYEAEPGSGLPDFRRLWPALHVIGKDILIPAHGIYWLTMLKAFGFADADLPRFLVHGFVNIAGGKMSKSIGNVVDPAVLAETYGPETLRYYLIRECVVGQDVEFSEDRLVGRYNTDLANELGNLLNRTLNMARRYRSGVVTRRAVHERDLPAVAEAAVAEYRARMDEFQPGLALEAAWKLAIRCNAFVEENAPWKLAKDPASADQLDGVLYALAESLRILSILITPVLPTASCAIRTQLALSGSARLVDGGWGAFSDGHTLGEPVPVFPRIERAEVAAD